MVILFCVAVFTVPSKLATNVPAVTVKSPVSPPVAVVVPTINLSSLSSQPIKALSLLPLSIIKPASFAGVPDVPLDNSIKLSLTVVFVVLMVVVVPFTVMFPVTTKFPPTVASLVTDKPVPLALLNVNVSAISAVLFASNAPVIVVVPVTVKLSATVTSEVVWPIVIGTPEVEVPTLIPLVVSVVSIVTPAVASTS